jgi:hypothetical protein
MHDPRPPSDEDPPSGPTQAYLDWARDTNFSYLNPGIWIPLLVEFDPKTPLEEFVKLKWLEDDLDVLKDSVAVADFLAEPPEALRKHKEFAFSILMIRRDPTVFARLTGSKGWTQTILDALIGPPFNPTDSLPRDADILMSGGPPPISLAPTPAPPPPSAPSPFPGPPPLSGGAPPTPPPTGGGATSAGSGRRVVVAVIDQGIAFASDRFTDAAGQTRIAYVWQQAFLGRTVPAPSTTFKAAPGVELDAAAITTARSRARAIGAGDDWIYTNFGGVDFSTEGYKPLAHRRAHGTHVLDLAAGNLDLAPGSANPSPHTIIAVDMPEDAVGDPAGSTLSAHAAWGLLYVMSRAEGMRNKATNETLAVVANLSYGPHEGAHDGLDLFERFMDALVVAYRTSPTPLEIVLAAGNFKQSRIHAAPQPGPGGPPPLQWRLQPGSLAPSMMEVWLSRNLVAGEAVTLQPPTGAPITVTSAMPRAKFPAGALPGAVQYSATYIRQKTVPGGVRRAHVVLAIVRTAFDPSSGWSAPTAESGVWTVQVNAGGMTLEAWIKRSDTQSGRRAKGRQSYFDDAAYPRFDRGGSSGGGGGGAAVNGRSSRPLDFDEVPRASYVARFQTLSGIATGQRTFAVGGYCESEKYPAMYSSHGTRRAGTALDCLAVSDDSRACRGVLAAGIMSGSIAAMNGTSVAAPQLTRLFADWRLATGAWPPNPVPGVVPLPAAPSSRPIPAGELAAAAGGGLLPALPRRIPRR